MPSLDTKFCIYARSGRKSSAFPPRNYDNRQSNVHSVHDKFENKSQKINKMTICSDLPHWNCIKGTSLVGQVFSWIFLVKNSHRADSVLWCRAAWRSKADGEMQSWSYTEWVWKARSKERMGVEVSAAESGAMTATCRETYKPVPGKGSKGADISRCKGKPWRQQPR